MIIRLAKPADVAAIIALMREFAVFEDLLDHFENTEERLSQVLFSEGTYVNALVTEADGRICAYSIFYPNFASFRGQLGMYLEDIYITEDHRGQGIGDAMLREIAKIAAGRGFDRIDFQVLDWNKSAIDFYEKLGAVRDDVERHFKFTDQAFAELSK
jgi:ribosomal protein S18 acetylase RimI-like enzyme